MKGVSKHLVSLRERAAEQARARAERSGEREPLTSLADYLRALIISGGEDSDAVRSTGINARALGLEL